METTIERILDGLRSAELSILECEKQVSKFESNASIRRSNSTYFLRKAEDSPNPDMEGIDRRVSLWFKDQADVDEQLAVVAIRRRERVIDLRQRWLVLLERFEDLN